MNHTSSFLFLFIESPSNAQTFSFNLAMHFGFPLLFVAESCRKSYSFSLKARCSALRALTSAENIRETFLITSFPCRLPVLLPVFLL